MSPNEFDNQFDVLYNNIASNQAPGLNAYEKSVFLTKAQDEVLKNHFTAQSVGNYTKQGFDGSPKRQIDFSKLIRTVTLNRLQDNINRIDTRSLVYSKPVDLLFIINERVSVTRNNGNNKLLQVIGIAFNDYTTLMSKPFKRPLKYQAWRLLGDYSGINDTTNRTIELIVNKDDEPDSNTSIEYTMRYIKRPRPIIVDDIEDLTINGYSFDNTLTEGSELDPILHEEILQRAVELANTAYSTDPNSVSSSITTGQRSE